MPALSKMVTHTKRLVAASTLAPLASLSISAVDAPQAAATPSLSYSLLSSSGQVVGLGGAYSAAAPSGQNYLSAPTAVADTGDGEGALVASADGAVTALGDARSAGSALPYHPVTPVVAIVNDARGGYWLATSAGGVFAFGGAPYLGGVGGHTTPGAIATMTATPDDGGYWLVTSTGAVYGFGDAHTYGSLSSFHLASPIVAMASSADGAGYWLASAAGGVFAFGDAAFHGSAGALHLLEPVMGIAASPDGNGYWLANARGGIFSFGDAPFMGSAAPMNTTFVSFSPGPAASTAVPIKAADAYSDPFRGLSITPMRIDEGVDYRGSGPVYALGDGVVESTTGPWPGGAFITYRLTNGPAAGRLVYLAENVTPDVKIGQAVTPATVVGTMHDSYPFVETGWAFDNYGDTMAAEAGAWNSTADGESLPSAYGINFNQLLVSLGAPSGEQMSSTVIGALSGWPTW